MRRVLPVLLVLALLAGCGGGREESSTSAAGGRPKPGKIEIWLAGLFATATPGTPYRKWIDSQVSRFEKKFPGSSVKVTLLPANNDQFSAKIQSAFAAHQVPDAMLIYSGGYTSPYTASLRPLNGYVDRAGIFDGITNWDLSCEGFDCQGGDATIYGVPIDFGTYGLFYNKALFAKAGVQAPIEDWDGLLAACDKLKAAGVVPITYGDRDGYSTDNWVTLMYASYFDEGDVTRVDKGELDYTDAKLVQPLDRLVQLRERGCVNPDASTRENSDANNLFVAQKTAMVLMYPAVIPSFEDALKSKLGIMAIPKSGDGPLAGRSAGNSFHNWVIPKDAKNPDLAWEFVKTASDATAGKEELAMLGTPPANAGAGATVQDPIVRFFVDASKDPAIPVLDSVIPVDVALFYYKQLQAAFAGKATPQQAMKNVQDALPRLNP
jgi:ABC-type glycerol-3-phosphate transport system substrate-binding protein